MAESHLTVRVSKKFLFTVAIVVVGVAAFGAGVFVSGSDSESSATTSTTSVETTTTSVETTVVSSNVVSSTATTSKPKPKKPAPTTTKAPQATVAVAPLSVDVSYSDNYPAGTPANAGQMGKMTLTWTSTSAVRGVLQIQHGSDFGQTLNVTPNDSLVIDRPCNNVRLADGSKPGQALTVAYRITVYDANGAQAQDGGTDSM